MDMDHGNSTESGGGMGMGGGCKISMLWNWNTIDACFISSDWHIKSKADFAGSVIGIFFLVILIEVVRRIHREYDRSIARAHAAKAPALEKTASSSSSKLSIFGSGIRPTFVQQLVRATLYMLQFGAGKLISILLSHWWLT
jgi:copper transporter 1